MWFEGDLLLGYNSDSVCGSRFIMFSLDRNYMACDQGVGSWAVYWRQADIR